MHTPIRSLVSWLRQSNQKARATARLQCDTLEDRLAPAVVSNASPVEQYLLELTNQLRANPTMLVNQIPTKNPDGSPRAQDLNEGVNGTPITTDPKQPLAWNNMMQSAAAAQAAYNIQIGRLDHIDANGGGPGQRFAAAGYEFSFAAENLYNGSLTGSDIVGAVADNARLAWFVDGNEFALVVGRGHRVNQMREGAREYAASFQAGQLFGQPGVYVAEVYGAGADLKNFVFDSNPFITGVAYHDTVKKDNFYTPGEGIGDVLVTVSQGGVKVDEVKTGGAGGYSIQVPAGTYDVTFTRPDGTTSKSTVTIDATAKKNVKLDYVATDIVAPATPPRQLRRSMKLRT